MSRIVVPNMLWVQHPEPAIAERLDRVLREWDRTPYESGQRIKGLAADCLGAVFGVIDEMDGRERAITPEFPPDTAMHSADTARKAMRRLLRLYAPNDKVDLPPNGVFRVRPGDVVITSYVGGGPGHVAMVGCRKNELWHSLPDNGGFTQRGWGFYDEQEICAVYRSADQERWRDATE